MAQNDGSFRTSLFDKHVEMDATMGQDGGWEMPMSYAGAIEEVGALRSRAGVLDVSHVGRIRVRGDEALDLIERVCTVSVPKCSFCSGT